MKQDIIQYEYILHDPNSSEFQETETALLTEAEAFAANQRLRYENFDLRWIKK